MSSPSSPAQKHLSEDDGSGSDEGSEVSLEPETDRFGFILTNGSTAGSVGPPPELVRQRETKWINIILQWDRMLLKKTSKVKGQCQKGIPASLRAKCWPLLCAATDRMKLNENLYKSLDSQPALQSWVDVIERDLGRQFPFHEMFLCKDGHGQRGLFRVLKAYTQYQPEEGYCQAQGPVAAVLLMNMPDEEAFWCLVQISEQYLPGYYSPLLEGVLFDAAMLTWVLRKTCPAVHKHLQHHGVEPLMFATDWLMCLFTRHLPFNTLLRVWDLFFCYGVRVLLQVAAVLVRRVLGRAEQRKQCQGQMETLERLRGVREQVQEDDDVFIAEVCSVPLSTRDLQKQTEKELEKWRRDRPSSTFDPRGRCHGYQLAWAKALQNKEERDRNERKTGNLSVPLSRSASTLSLSPSLFRKRLRKGSKVDTGDWEGGVKVVRHLSMGAKEDWRNWNDYKFKRVQGVQEEEDVEEHQNQSEAKLTGQTKEKEHSEESKTTDEVQTTPALHTEEETETVKELNDRVETGTAEMGESQDKETDDDKMLSGPREETDDDTEQQQHPAEDHTVEDTPQSTGSQKEQGEDVGSDSQSQVTKQSHSVQPKETDDDKILSGPREETDEETEQQQSPAEDQTVEDTPQPTGSQKEQGEEVGSDSQSQVTKQSHSVQPKETDDDKILSGPREETDEETEQQQSPAEDQTVEDTPQPTGSQKEQGEEVGSDSQSQVTKQSHSVQPKETDDDKILSGPREETDEETEQQQSPAEDQTVEDTPQPTGSQKEQGEEVGSDSQSQATKQSHSIQDKETEDDKMLSGQREETDEEQHERPAEDQTVDDIPQLTDHSSHKEQGEEVGSDSQSQAPEQSHSVQDKETEVEDTKKENEELSQSEQSAAVEENQSEVRKDIVANTYTDREVEVNINEEQLIQADRKPAEGTDGEQMKVDAVTEVSETKTEATTGSETDGSIEAATLTDPTEMETQEVVITEPEESSQVEGKYQSTESPTAREMTEELNTQTETETEQVEENAASRDEWETEIVQTESEHKDIKIETKPEAEKLIPPSPECIEQQEDTEAQVPAPEDDNDAKEQSEVFACCPESEGGEVPSEPAKEKEGVILRPAEETDTTDTRINVEATDSVTPTVKEEETSTQAEAENLAEETRTSGEPAPEEPTSQVAVEKEITEHVRESTVGESDVFLPAPDVTGHLQTDSNPQSQNKDDCGSMPAPGRYSSRSSGDFCVRKLSASSRGAMLARKLSVELFTFPQKTSQPPQTISDRAEVKHTEPLPNPGAVSSSEGPAAQKEPPVASKRFGLFRRLRGGGQPKQAKEKGAQKMQVPKILVQDFGDGTATGRPVEVEGCDESLSSRERRRRRRERERERREKEEEKSRKKKEKEMEKEKERARRKPQTRGKSFQGQKERSSNDPPRPAKTCTQTLRYSAPYTESYF